MNLKQLQQRLQSNVDRQQVLYPVINRGRKAQEEYNNIEKENKSLVLRIVEMKKADNSCEELKASK